MDLLSKVTRKDLVYLSLILVLLVLNGLGRSNSRKSVAGSTVEGETAKSDDLSGWQTYVNSFYTFSLKYPSDFAPTVISGSDPKQVSFGLTKEDPVFDVRVMSSNPSRLKLADWLLSNKVSYQTSEKMKIGGFATANDAQSPFRYYVGRDDKVYILECLKCVGDEKMASIFNLAISSLKFL